MGEKKLDLKDIIKKSKGSAGMDSSYHSLIQIFPLKMIESETENRLALALSERLIELLNGSKSQLNGVTQYLRILSHLIHTYESSRFKTSRSTGRKMLAYLMELHDLKQTVTMHYRNCILHQIK